MNVLWNGQLKRAKEVVISPLDHGFLYGMGLFETFRTYGGRPWLIERHAARLEDGCRQLGIRFKPDLDRLRHGVRQLLEAGELEDGYIRWSVSAGEDAVGLPTGPYEMPVEIVYAKPLVPDSPDTRPGKTVRLLSVPRSSPEAKQRLKSFHYMNNILAKRELAEGGAGSAAEGLFLDGRGNVCEGIVSNVFWLSEGVLYTPSLDTGPLPGITREFVLELAIQTGYPVSEGQFGWTDVARADEAFLTNSVQELVPVAALEDETGRTVRQFEAAGEGSATRRLMRLYRSCAQGSEPDEPDILP